MTYPEHNDAAQLELLAAQLAPERPEAAAALRWVAALLRDDRAQAQSWLTRLVGEIEVGELLGVAAIRLDMLAADKGHPRIAQAAARVAEAALLYDASQQREDPL